MASHMTLSRTVGTTRVPRARLRRARQPMCDLAHPRARKARSLRSRGGRRWQRRLPPVVEPRSRRRSSRARSGGYSPRSCGERDELGPRARQNAAVAVAAMGLSRRLERRAAAAVRSALRCSAAQRLRRRDVAARGRGARSRTRAGQSAPPLPPSHAPLTSAVCAARAPCGEQQQHPLPASPHTHPPPAHSAAAFMRLRRGISRNTTTRSARCPAARVRGDHAARPRARRSRAKPRRPFFFGRAVPVPVRGLADAATLAELASVARSGSSSFLSKTHQKPLFVQKRHTS